MTTELLTDPDTITFRGIPLDQIRPSPTQPRKTFDAAELEELAESIRRHGVVEPLVVRPAPGPAAACVSLYHLAIGDGDPEAIEAAKALEAIGCHDRDDLERRARGRYQGSLYAAVRGVVNVTAKSAKALERVLSSAAAGGRAAAGYELVAGERRLRAATIAGLEAVPCTIRCLTDEEVWQIQTVENGQRADLKPREEAAGYRLGLERFGFTVEQLAEKLGKSKTQIYGRLKLLELPEKAAQAVDNGTLPAATAQLIARIPSKKVRDAAATVILTGRDSSDYRIGDGPLSYRQAAELIQRKWMIELKQAPFSQKDESLVPSAGACTTCPKKTGNNREEYPEGRADVCTDPECYRQKVQAHQARLRDQAVAQGKTVLTGKKGEEAIHQAGHYGGGEYVRVDGVCYDDPRGRTFGKILGKAAQEHVVLAENRHGSLVPLLPKAAVKPLLKEKGIGKKAAAVDPDAARRRREEKIKAEAGRRCVAQAVAAGEELMDRILDMLAGERGRPDPGTLDRWGMVLRQAVKAMVREVYDEKRTKICNRRELPVPEQKFAGARRVFKDYTKGLDNFVLDEAALHQVFGLLVELAALRMTEPNWREEGKGEHRDFWSQFGVDPKAVERGVRQEWAAKGKAKGKGKAKKAAKPSANGPTDGPADPALTHVGDLDLPEKLWRRLDAEGLSTVADLKAERDLAGGALGDSLVQTRGLKPKEAAKVEEVLEEFLRAQGERRCRVCGCTDEDGEGCIERTGDACTWVEPDLCSACVGEE